MITEKDIWRTAQLLVKQHGEDPPIHAAMKADEMLEKGDVEGALNWRRILTAVEELQRDQAADGETTH